MIQDNKHTHGPQLLVSR